MKPEDVIHHPAGGLTARDYIAIKAMDSVMNTFLIASHDDDIQFTEERFVAACYRRADAMIEESNK